MTSRQPTSSNYASVFDAQWYSQRYPDVAQSQLDPLTHYLRYGESLGRKASPVFDPLFYCERYPELAALSTSPLSHFIRQGQQQSRQGHAITVDDFTQQLWRHEHIPDCLSALRRFANRCSGSQGRAASWQLARWTAWQEDWEACLHWLCLYFKKKPPKTPWPVVQLLYCEALARTGEHKTAEYFALDLIEHYPNYENAKLALSNVIFLQLKSILPPHKDVEMVSELHRKRVELINRIYVEQGLAQLGLSSAHQFTLDHLKTSSATHPHSSKFLHHCNDLVTIIVPVYNAADVLATSLQSLAMQSYAHLEVLIVDDASTDASAGVAEAFTRRDCRFRLLKAPFNQGAYAARNLALKQAKGDYITVQDADDWAHPDKIACQLAAFKKHPEWLANTSDMVRCTADLHFGRWRLPNSPNAGWVYRNTSSLMFRRKVHEILGYWDRVRTTADTEYLHRIMAAFGSHAYGEVLKGTPLAFCRQQTGSLSQISDLHLVTHDKGLRRDYMRAAKAWHAQAKQPTDLWLSDQPHQRPFASPKKNLPG